MLRHWRPGRIAAALLLAGCAPEQAPEAGDFSPEYLGVETRLLKDDLVTFEVRMRGAWDGSDVSQYARCAAAQYTLIRGYSFARHLRTSASEEGGLWTGDAVYTISADLPQGLQTIDAEVVLDHCKEQGIPAV